MPIELSRILTGRHRSPPADLRLGCVLAGIAGAINAGAFLAVQRYTSHMTGIVSTMADDVALGHFDLALMGAGALAAFMAGAFCAAVMVSFARRRHLHSQYALPLMLEAFLLLCFGLLGAQLTSGGGWAAAVTIMLLSFIMGLQNATLTTLTNAEIRTTHVTGIVTDIGIELGRAAYANAARSRSRPPVLANIARLKALSALVLAFFAGGVLGALGFKNLGFVATVPVSLCLMVLALAPVVDDVLESMGHQKKP